MNTQYISLGVLAEQMEDYDRLPVRLQEAMQNSVWLTLKTNLICIPVLLIVPRLLGPVFANGFFNYFNPTAQATEMLVGLIHGVSDELLIMNVVSLVLVGLVLLLSQGMSEAVGEPVHWAAWAAAFPSGISAFSTAVMGILSGLLVLTTLAIWIMVIIAATFCVIVALWVLFAGR